MSRKVNVTFEGKTIGTAEVNDGNMVAEIELERKDLKHITSGYDLTENLSIAFKDVEMVDVVSAYPTWDAEAMEAYYKNRPKGTFDA